MGKINMGRVVLAGVVAAIVLSIFDGVLQGVVLADAWEVAMKAMNKTPAFAPGQIVGFNVLNLAAGIFIVWIYAAMRPRFGAGPKTAVCAGLAAWFMGILFANAALIVADVLPAKLMVTGIVVGIPQYILAALAGGKLYKE
jgi:hypothetical protein